MALSDEPQCLLLHFNMSGFLSFTHVYATLLGKHSLKKEKILTSLLLFFKYFGLKLCVWGREREKSGMCMHSSMNR